MCAYKCACIDSVPVTVQRRSQDSGRGLYQGCTPCDLYDVMNKWPPMDEWGLVHNCLPLTRHCLLANMCARLLAI